jgi:hypothetical protein
MRSEDASPRLIELSLRHGNRFLLPSFLQRAVPGPRRVQTPEASGYPILSRLSRLCERYATPCGAALQAHIRCVLESPQSPRARGGGRQKSAGSLRTISSTISTPTTGDPCAVRSPTAFSICESHTRHFAGGDQLPQQRFYASTPSASRLPVRHPQTTATLELCSKPSVQNNNQR